MTGTTPLRRSATPLTSRVEMDPITAAVVAPFDYKADGCEAFYPYELPALPDDWGIGVMVGGSGSGKTTLASRIGRPADVAWTDQSIASHFASADDAMQRLTAAGLSSVPDWVKPYFALSNGQQFRADLARRLTDGAVIDEFTSVVDRNVAKAASSSLARYVRTGAVRRLTLVTCHRDVLEWLQPDWVIDTDAGYAQMGGRFPRPVVELVIRPCAPAVWRHFAAHHYLSGDIADATHNYLAMIDDEPVAFYSVIAFPNGSLKRAWRGHRLVVLPDFQGLGIGPRLAEAVAGYYTGAGRRFFAKTAHPRLGAYRDQSPRWVATSKNHMRRTDAVPGRHRWDVNPERWTYSHEYVGPPTYADGQFDVVQLGLFEEALS